MNTETRDTAQNWLWKIPVIAIIYFFGLMISGAVVTSIGMEFPEIRDFTYSPLLSFVGALVLAVAVSMLARGLRGSWTFRWLALFAFTYISYCVNNQIEAAIFTTLGGFSTMLVFFVVPCAMVAGTAALLIKPPAEAAVLETVFSKHPMSVWWWRAALAWLAFPVIYHFFGMLIYPFVADVYAGEKFGLMLPSQSVIVSVVSLRSLLFLLVIIPILTNWSKSRRSLLVAFAAALTAMVGAVGIIESGWMTPTMRIVHGLEITADSIVHAWVLVALLVPKTITDRKRSDEMLRAGGEAQSS
jgi:hypothetical protein